jgi:hypothetical protein
MDGLVDDIHGMTRGAGAWLDGRADLEVCALSAPRRVLITPIF